MKRHISKVSILLTVVAVLSLSVGSVWATPAAPLLNFSPEHFPLIYSYNIKVDYYPTGGAGGSGHLSALGTSLLYRPEPGVAIDIDVDGTFSVEADIDQATGVAESATLTVTGLVGGLPIAGLPDENLFSSTILMDFGSGAEDKFEFLFTQQGDMLAPNGAPVGVLLSAWGIDDFNDPNDPVFDHEWHNYDPFDPFLFFYPGDSDSFYLPEPTTMIVLAVAGGLGLLRRRRQF